MIYTCSSATNTTCAAQSYCHWSSYTTTCSFSPSWEELLACPGSKVRQCHLESVLCKPNSTIDTINWLI